MSPESLVESLYRGSAEYYERGRLPYPPEIVEAFRASSSWTAAAGCSTSGLFSQRQREVELVIWRP